MFVIIIVTSIRLRPLPRPIVGRPITHSLSVSSTPGWVYSYAVCTNMYLLLSSMYLLFLPPQPIFASCTQFYIPSSFLQFFSSDWRILGHEIRWFTGSFKKCNWLTTTYCGTLPKLATSRKVLRRLGTPWSILVIEECVWDVILCQLETRVPRCWVGGRFG